MKKILNIIFVSFVVLICLNIVVLADAKSASNYAKEAAEYAAKAYEFAQKINYNSNGRVKYYARQAMDAAKKAESAANKAHDAFVLENNKKKPDEK